MTMMNFILGILASVLANNLSTIRELVERNKTLQQRLDDCFEKAVDRWNAPKELKQSTLLDPVRFTSKLKDYIEHPEKGMHSKDKELMRLWVNAIMADGNCCAYILSIKEDLILAIQKDGFKDILTRLEEMMKEQCEANCKIDDLWKRGGKSVKQFWDEVSIFDRGRKQLPYLTIMGGRVSEAEVVRKAIESPELVVIEAQSRLEAKAFTTAAILDNGGNTDAAIVVENRELYDQLVNEETRYVIITSIAANHQVAVANGHSVIYCVGPQDNYADTHMALPEIDREVYLQSLESTGVGDNVARRLALDSAKDVNILWRLLHIVQTPPVWETRENIQKFIPILLIGRWDESREDDKQLLKELTRSESYESFLNDFNSIIIADESPLKKIGSVYALKSPYAMFKRYFKYVTEPDMAHFLEYVTIVFEDVDLEAIEKMESQELRFWKTNRVFSSNLRKGIAEGLTLIALMQEELGQDNIVEKWIAAELKAFDLQKYLSHKYNLSWMAEASPKAFLQFIENDLQHGSPIMNEIFIIRSDQYGLTGTNIYYTELLGSLECIAWKEEYLPQVTRILLHLCSYPNDSNWVNRPSYSLENIYRYVLPCTFASLDKRIKILKSLQKRYPQAVHNLCFSWMKGLKASVYHPNQYFRWRWAEEKPELPKGAARYPKESEMCKMYDLMMHDFAWTEDKVIELLELSMQRYMIGLRRDILDKVRSHTDELRGNDKICEVLRKDIYRHMECQDTWWSVKGEELEMYRDLLRDLTLSDVVNANKHLFDSVFMYNPEMGITHKTENPVDEAMKIRAKIEDQIIKEKGLKGIWNLVAVAKSPEAVAGGFEELTGDQYRMLVYERYCKGELCEPFVRRYFLNLYYRHREDGGKYVQYISEMQAYNTDKIAVVLYAPGFYRDLTEIAETQTENVKEEYWHNVQRSGTCQNEDVPYIIDRLLQYMRYDDLLSFLTENEALAVMTSKQKADVLYSVFNSEGINEMVKEPYYVAKILGTIEPDGDGNIEHKVVQIEFYLYEHLKHYLDKEHNHFEIAVNSNPEMMMEILTLYYRAYERDNLDLSEDEASNKQIVSTVAFHYWYNYADVPCTNADGSIDGDKLKAFLQRLQELAIECHIETKMPFVIGKILGNFPEDEEYPSQLLCDLVEEYNDDRIDSDISVAIHNRRSFSTRSPFDGGTVERFHIETLQKYRERAVLRSPRFVKILDSTIEDFERAAKRNDFEGQMNNLDY